MAIFHEIPFCPHISFIQGNKFKDYPGLTEGERISQLLSVIIYTGGGYTLAEYDECRDWYDEERLVNAFLSKRQNIQAIPDPGAQMLVCHLIKDPSIEDDYLHFAVPIPSYVQKKFKHPFQGCNFGAVVITWPETFDEIGFDLAKLFPELKADPGLAIRREPQKAYEPIRKLVIKNIAGGVKGGNHIWDLPPD